MSTYHRNIWAEISPETGGNVAGVLNTVTGFWCQLIGARKARDAMSKQREKGYGCQPASLHDFHQSLGIIRLSPPTCPCSPPSSSRCHKTASLLDTNGVNVISPSSRQAQRSMLESTNATSS